MRHRYKGEAFPHASPPIILKNNKYCVIEYRSTEFNLGEKKLTGFLLLFNNTGKYLQNKSSKEDLLKTFMLWRYIYFDSRLFKDIKKHRLNSLAIKNRLIIQNKLKDAIEKWNKNSLRNVDEKVIKDIEELNKQAIEQYPILIEKLELELWIIKNIYVIFEKPSF